MAAVATLLISVTVRIWPLTIHNENICLAFLSSAKVVSEKKNVLVPGMIAYNGCRDGSPQHAFLAPFITHFTGNTNSCEHMRTNVKR